MTSQHSTRKQVLLTGGNGTLGYNILKLLADDARYQVSALVRNAHLPALAALSDRVRFIEHDLNDTVFTAQIFERVRPEVVVHCAASGMRLPRGSWFDLMQFNAACTMGLFQMNCRLAHPSHFIYISTGLVYREQGRPLTEEDPLGTRHPYGASKAATDLMLQAAATEFHRRLTILRPFAFTGVHDCGNRLFPQVLQAALSGRRLSLTEGRQVRDYCSVNDIAQGVAQVIERDSNALVEEFNLGSGLSIPLRDLIEDVCKQLAIAPELAFGESEMSPFETNFLVANTSRARQQLGWAPQIGVSYAVWELAQQLCPSLPLRRPERSYGVTEDRSSAEVDQDFPRGDQAFGSRIPNQRGASCPIDQTLPALASASSS